MMTELLTDALEQVNGNTTGLTWMFYVAWAFSGYLLMTSFFGCVSACNSKSKCYTGCFFTLNLLMILTSGAILGKSWYETERIDFNLLETLQEYRLDPYASYNESFTNFEQDFKCCGTVEIDYFGDAHCFQWYSNLPVGCFCDPETDDSGNCITYQEANDNYYCRISEYDANNNGYAGIYGVGCGDDIIDSSVEIREALNITVIFVFGCTFLAGVLAIFLCCRSTKKD